MSLDKKTLKIAATAAVVAVIITAGGAMLYMNKKSETPADDGAVVAALSAWTSTPMAAAPGTNQAPAPPSGGPMPTAPAAGQLTGKSSLTMEQAADRLSKRLEQKDGSAADWALLARSYMELKRYVEADRAFARAIAISPGDEALRKDAAAARQAATRPPQN